MSVVFQIAARGRYFLRARWTVCKGASIPLELSDSYTVGSRMDKIASRASTGVLMRVLGGSVQPTRSRGLVTGTTMWALGVSTARRTVMALAVTATRRDGGQVTSPGTGAVVMAVARGHVGPLAPPPHAAKGPPTWLHPVWGRVHHRRRPVLLPTPGVYSTP